MPKIFRIFCPLLFYIPCQSQDSSNLTGIPDKLYETVFTKQEKVIGHITKQEERLLTRLQKQEARIYKYLRRVDSSKAELLSIGVSERYQSLQQTIKGPLSATDKVKAGQYIPRLDSLTSMLRFLEPVSTKKEQVEKALSSVSDLKGRLAQAGDIETFIAERQEALKSLTHQFTNLPSGITKSISRYSKEAYYFKERISGWRQELKDPAKLEKDALKIVSKIPAFQQFMQTHGELAQLFGPASSGAPANGGAALAGLQTRASVQQLLQQQLGSGGVNLQQYIQQQLGAAQAELGKLKQKLEGLKSGSTDIGNSDIPDFSKNTLKVKPFLKRLEYGWNLQTASHAAYSFPNSNDLGASIGYKFTDKLVAGFGIACKFGLGSAWNKIAFTSDGIGIRSYVDFKISSPQKGIRVLFSNLWLSGGYEQNYWAKFKNFPELRKVSWETSGLIGISKKIRYKKREAKTQILWDFLANSHQPKGQSLKFRVGYTL